MQAHYPVHTITLRVAACSCHTHAINLPNCEFQARGCAPEIRHTAKTAAKLLPTWLDAAQRIFLGDFGSGKLSISAIPVFCRQIGMPFLRQNRTSASADIVEADSIYPVLNTFVTMPALGKRLRQTFRIFSSWASPRGLQTSKSISESDVFAFAKASFTAISNPSESRFAPQKSPGSSYEFFFVRTPSSRE